MATALLFFSPRSLAGHSWPLSLHFNIDYHTKKTKTKDDHYLRERERESQLVASPHRFFFFFLLPSIVFGGNSGNRRPSDFLRSTDQPVRAARRFLTRNLVLRRFPHGVIFSLGRPSVATLHRRARAASLFFSNPKQKKTRNQSDYSMEMVLPFSIFYLFFFGFWRLLH